VRIFPVRVQGTEAPGEIASAIRFANAYQLADVLIVGRGGGSIEDLWAFNDEQVAYAIYDSKIPIISAVGHEPDVTISDYVADLRAATPSNAAELAVPDQAAVSQLLDQYSGSMAASLSKQIGSARRHLETLRCSAALQSPENYLMQSKTLLNNLQDRLASAANQAVSHKKQKFIGLASKLEAMSPLKVLSRGYSMTTAQDGTVISSYKQLSLQDEITVTLSNGQFRASVLEVKENDNGQ